MEYPHRVVDNVLDGLAGGATGLVSGAKGVLSGVGKSVMSGLDKPFNAITGKEGPHRVVDRAADGFLNAGQEAINQGFIGAIKTFGKGVMSALDQPLEQLSGMGIGKPKFLKK